VDGGLLLSAKGMPALFLNTLISRDLVSGGENLDDSLD
jgi:hypothetical protein